MIGLIFKVLGCIFGEIQYIKKLFKKNCLSGISSYRKKIHNILQFSSIHQKKPIKQQNPNQSNSHTLYNIILY